jgi:hypothetical protein
MVYIVHVVFYLSSGFSSRYCLLYVRDKVGTKNAVAESPNIRECRRPKSMNRFAPNSLF